VAEFIAGLDYPMFVVTAADVDTGERSGCLVGFATQCSIVPLRFLVCLSRTNHTHRVAGRSRILAVHALSAGQRDLAVLFGEQTGDEVDKFTRVLDRFDLGDHTGHLLAPVQETGLAAPTLMFSAVRDLQAGHPA
jgi:flavin reductase (DIM6/NTAB) family NADH-FMN oxidoreductase RutF